MLTEPRDPVDAAEELAHIQCAVPDDKFRNYVTELLLRLDELGLVERSGG